MPKLIEVIPLSKQTKKRRKLKILKRVSVNFKLNIMNSQDFKKKIDSWKSSIEQLNEQLHLGIDDAKTEFEVQKKNLKGWIDTLEDKITVSEEIGKEKVEKLKGSIDELRVQAALGKAETADAMHSQQKIINKKIVALKSDFNSFYNTAENDVSEKLDDFHTRFDLFKLQIHLGQKETEDSWKIKRKELSNQLNDLKSKIESNKEFASESVDHFSKEITATWKHLQNAFKYKEMK